MDIVAAMGIADAHRMKPWRPDGSISSTWNIADVASRKELVSQLVPGGQIADGLGDSTLIPKATQRIPANF